MKKIIPSVIVVEILMLLFNISSQAQQMPKADVFAGKKIAFLGDSYVRNHKDPVDYTWQFKFAKKHNMEYVGLGKNGNCIAYTRGGKDQTKGMYLRYAYMPDSLDYIVVVGGHNDAVMLDSMGGISVFKERMELLCEGLIGKYPSSRIFFFTRWTSAGFKGSNAEAVVDAMIEICGRFSIPIFDAARNSGMHANVESFRKLYYQRSTDDAHLNARGHDRFLPVAEHFLLQYK